MRQSWNLETSIFEFLEIELAYIPEISIMMTLKFLPRLQILGSGALMIDPGTSVH